MYFKRHLRLAIGLFFQQREHIPRENPAKQGLFSSSGPQSSFSFEKEAEDKTNSNNLIRF